MTNYLAQAQHHMRVGEFSDAIAVLHAHLLDAQKANDPRLSRMYSTLGIAERMIGNHLDLAVAHHHAAIGTAQTDADRANAYTNLADSYRKLGVNAEALRAVNIALSHAPSQSLEHAVTRDQRGLVLFAQKDNDAALDLYLGAKEICEMILKTHPAYPDAHNRLAQVLQHEATVYLFREKQKKAGEQLDAVRLENATRLLERGLNILTSQGDRVNLSNAHNTSGAIERLRGNREAALRHYEAGLEHAKAVGYNANINGAGIYRTELYLELGKLEEAQAAADQFVSGVQKGWMTKHDVKVYEDWIKTTIADFEARKLDAGGLKGLLAMLEK